MENQKPDEDIIDNELFTQAFCKLFKCKPDEFIIEMVEENRVAVVIYKQEPYQIRIREVLFEDVKDMLTDSRAAQLINLSIWLKATFGILSDGLFYIYLIDLLRGVEQFNILNTALSTSSFASDDNEEVFWKTLQAIDNDGMVFGNAIVAAAKTYDLDRLADEILDWQIVNGDIVYNLFVGGIFEEVSIGEEPNEINFYIYSADSSHWST